MLRVKSGCEDEAFALADGDAEAELEGEADDALEASIAQLASPMLRSRFPASMK